MVRALSGDADLIYEFVRNTVDTEFQFGLAKGELGALVDRSGTAFDQAKLLVELLREAGFSAKYKFGDIQLTGAQLQAWTGFSSARQACEFLAGGGIPVIINGSTTSCNQSGSVNSATIAHVWVEAVIDGQTVLLDPSYKPYEHLSGVDVRAISGFVSGSPLATAAQGVARADGGATTGNYNGSGLASLLEARANALRQWMRQDANRGLSLDEVVGGRRIVPADRPVGGWRQSSLPHASTVRATWTGGIPDVYRSRLAIHYRPVATQPGVDLDFFSDEIYGRPLVFLQLAVEWDGVSLVSMPTPGPCPSCAPFLGYNVEVSVNRPFAANGGGYGDTIIRRPLPQSLNGAVLVQGWGATSQSHSEKWAREIERENPFPDDVHYPHGKGRRATTSIEWLTQFSRALAIQEQISASRVTHMHSIGFVYAVSNYNIGNETRTDGADVLDIETAVSVTNRTGDAVRRRALIHALASTAATLEGSVAEQLTNSPESSSTARRLTWSNSNVGNRAFYSLAAGTSAPATSAFTQNVAVQDHRQTLRSALAAYLSNGFSVTTATDAHLGPGGGVWLLPGL